MVSVFPSLLRAAVLGALFFSLAVEASIAKGEEVIQNGSVVSLEYSISGEQGRLIESNKGEGPFSYTHGQGQIIRGLEKGLEGMRVGEQKTLQLKPEDAYGRINPSAFREVPRENIPPNVLKVGAALVAHTAHGQSHRVRVHEIRENTVVLDFNHPLRSKTLIFEVKILSIEPGQKK